MELQDMAALERTFRTINAKTQSLYSSDYPPLGFRLGIIRHLPFLFELPPSNEKQAETLKKFGDV